MFEMYGRERLGGARDVIFKACATGRCRWRAALLGRIDLRDTGSRFFPSPSWRFSLQFTGLGVDACTGSFRQEPLRHRKS
jgi:hypothetical protein